MLRMVHSMGELPFPALMNIYREENQALGAKRWPWENEARQLALAEEEFRNYLESIFFSQPGAVYALWEVGEKPRSALRLELYRDGLLLEALATAPEERRKGYARSLIQAVVRYLQALGKTKVYAHVGKKNIPSLGVHECCGFVKISDSAVYIDGSADSRSVTLRLDIPGTTQ